MRVAIGLKSHSGWAALVALAQNRDELLVLHRCRMECAGVLDGKWARHPYHAAQELAPEDARKFVEKEQSLARACASARLREVVDRFREDGQEVVACCVVAGEAMPPWRLDEILSMHVRMHKAEGSLYREVLEHAANECGLKTLHVPDKRLEEMASDKLGCARAEIASTIGGLGKRAGPPWGKDQKEAALAAWMALCAAQSHQTKG